MRRRLVARNTLWTPRADVDGRLFDYTVGEDRVWDTALLRWDVLGSLGHVAALRASGLVTAAEHRRLRAGLRAALVAVEAGELVIERTHEDAHSAVELWLTRRSKDAGRRVHAARSRNDQIACDLRLFLKDALLGLHHQALGLVNALLTMARRHRRVLWPGYTHQRRAMPSSVGLWAGALAEGLLDTLESAPALWGRLDRSPLGSAAGYGVPLPYDREAAARALGFAGVEHNVAAVQNGRGKLEAATLFWCSELAHDLSRLAVDVTTLSMGEIGLLVIPVELATGSSIMPHKRNPDIFELTRARAAAVDGDLGAVLHLKAKLGTGYHRDAQLLKEPLLRGLRRTDEMLAMMAWAVPLLGVDRERCAALLEGGVLATDEVMRRVEEKTPFRTAYRQVADELANGETFPPPSTEELLQRRRGTGNAGNLGLPVARARATVCRRWAAKERRRFETALRRLAGSRRRKG